MAYCNDYRYIIAHGRNPIFGNHQSTHSHRSEIYAARASFKFLNEYCKNFQIQNNRVNILYYDNKEVFKNLNAIIRNKRTYHHGYRIPEHEAVLVAISLLSRKLQVIHINTAIKIKPKGNII